MKRVRPSKRQISRLVSFKLNMTANMLFKMVISLLNSDLTAAVKNESWKSFIVVVVFTIY